jgi:hypothetical protein
METTLLNSLICVDVGSDKTQWETLRNRCSFLSDWGLKILYSGLAQYTGTIIIEPHYVCKDHRNLFSNFYSKKLNSGSANAARFHFFSEKGITPDSFFSHPTAYQNEYIGFSVIRPVAQRCLGRTVIDPHKVGRRFEDGFYSLRTPYPVNINGRGLRVAGYPYVSQDTDATVCAHATLWGVCRYFSQRHPAYAEILPYDLVRLTATTMGRVVPYRGMTYSDYSKILSDFGCHPLVLLMKESETETELNDQSFRDVYSYVESGIPVLASFGGHVGALVGHTLDLDRNYTPDEDNVVPSSAFLSQFILVDDNFFPYQLLGYPGDPKNYFTKFNINSMITAVCPLPEKVYLSAQRAQKQARALLKNLSNLYPSEFSTDKDNPMVTRLFFTTGSSLKRRKIQMAAAAKNGGLAFDGISAFIASIRFPHFVWIMEFGPLALYKSGR